MKLKKLMAATLCLLISVTSLSACAGEEPEASSSKPVSSSVSKKESKTSSKKTEVKSENWDSKKLEEIPEVISGIKDMTAEKTAKKDES